MRGKEIGVNQRLLCEEPESALDRCTRICNILSENTGWRRALRQDLGQTERCSGVSGSGAQERGQGRSVKGIRSPGAEAKGGKKRINSYNGFDVPGSVPGTPHMASN